MYLCSRKIAVGCVGENTQRFLVQSLRLLQSLRWFGGSIANADIFLCFVDGVDPNFEEVFRRLGAHVRVVRRFHPLIPHANKLRFLELPELGEYETVILIDTDIIFVQDPVNSLVEGCLMARIAGLPTVNTCTFKKIFSYFCLMPPSEDHYCSVSGDRTIWYCNSGVVVLPAKILKEFFPVWRHFITELLESGDLIREIGVMVDQASFVIAYFVNPVPFTFLPLSLNLPVPKNENVVENVKHCDPVIVHYHGQIDASGLIIPNYNLHARKRIEAFNQMASRERLPTIG